MNLISIGRAGSRLAEAPLSLRSSRRGLQQLENERLPVVLLRRPRAPRAREDAQLRAVEHPRAGPRALFSWTSTLSRRVALSRRRPARTRPSISVSSFVGRLCAQCPATVAFPTSLTVKSTFASNKTASAFLFDPYAARIAGVDPSRASRASPSAPHSSNARVAPAASANAAWCRAVAPLSSLGVQIRAQVTQRMMLRESSRCAAKMTAVFPPGTHGCFALGSMRDFVLASTSASGIFASTASASALRASNHHVSHSAAFAARAGVLGSARRRRGGRRPGRVVFHRHAPRDDRGSGLCRGDGRVPRGPRRSRRGSADARRAKARHEPTRGAPTRGTPTRGTPTPWPSGVARACSFVLFS